MVFIWLRLRSLLATDIFVSSNKPAEYRYPYSNGPILQSVHVWLQLLVAL